MTSINSFNDLSLAPEILSAVEATGYTQPTPIQAQAIPILLEGHDLLGIAQTGTGKTAAFSLPLIHKLFTNKGKRHPKSTRSLILTPTRELAIQIQKNIETYAKNVDLRHTVIFGGVSQVQQVKALGLGVDILVATPGRLLDLISQNKLRLDRVEVFILDEADRMLDMGFAPDIKKIVPMLPPVRHNLFFSATMPKEIQSMAQSILVNPKKVEITPPATTVERIDQSVMYVDKKDKLNLLIHVLNHKDMKKVLVFVGMKHLANRVVEKLFANKISCAAIHGNKSQNARQNALEDFTRGKVRVLVATDIASRGIDVDNISHVINFDLPNAPEDYVHRIGRTARAGSDGSSVSFCTGEEKSLLAYIEKTTRQTIRVDDLQPYHSAAAAGAQIMKPGRAKAILDGERRKEGREHRKSGRSSSRRPKGSDTRGNDRRTSRTSDNRPQGERANAPYVKREVAAAPTKKTFESSERAPSGRGGYKPSNSQGAKVSAGRPSASTQRGNSTFARDPKKDKPSDKPAKSETFAGKFKSKFKKFRSKSQD